MRLRYAGGCLARVVARLADSPPELRDTLELLDGVAGEPTARRKVTTRQCRL